MRRRLIPWMTQNSSPPQGVSTPVGGDTRGGMWPWLVGLAVFLAVTSPLWRPGQSLALVVAIGVLAGMRMAVSVAAVTGWVMWMLLQSRLPIPVTTGPADAPT